MAPGRVFQMARRFAARAKRSQSGIRRIVAIRCCSRGARTSDLEGVTFEFDGPWPGISDGSKIRGASKAIAERNPTDSGDQVLLPWSKNFRSGRGNFRV